MSSRSARPRKQHRILLVVVHQRRSPDGFSHECHAAREVNVTSPQRPPIVFGVIPSRIPGQEFDPAVAKEVQVDSVHPRPPVFGVILSPVPGQEFHCGSRDPAVVDELKRASERIEKGRCFAGGPIAGLPELLAHLRPEDDLATVKRKFREHVYSGQERKRSRETPKIRMALEEIYSALTMENPARRIRSEAGSVVLQVPERTRGCFWELLRELDGSDREDEEDWRKREASKIANELIKSAPVLWEIPSRRRFLLANLLARRANVGQGGTRFAFKDPCSLAQAIAVEILLLPKETVRESVRSLRNSSAIQTPIP